MTPGTESCDNKDNDCDGSTDERDAVGCTDYYYDYDKDGWGRVNKACYCSAANGTPYTATKTGDCNDDPSAGGATVYPGQTQFFTVPYNGSKWDYNCSGKTEKQFTGTAYCDGSTCKQVGTGYWWATEPGMCGVVGKKFGSCALSGSSCYTTYTNVTLACH